MKESSGNPKSATTRFVANMEIGELTVLGFGDLAHDSLKSVLCGGDGTVVTRLGVTIRFEDGDDNTRRVWTN